MTRDAERKWVGGRWLLCSSRSSAFCQDQAERLHHQGVRWRATQEVEVARSCVLPTPGTAPWLGVHTRVVDGCGTTGTDDHVDGCPDMDWMLCPPHSYLDALTTPSPPL